MPPPAGYAGETTGAGGRLPLVLLHKRVPSIRSRTPDRATGAALFVVDQSPDPSIKSIASYLFFYAGSTSLTGFPSAVATVAVHAGVTSSAS